MNNNETDNPERTATLGTKHRMWRQTNHKTQHWKILRKLNTHPNPESNPRVSEG